MSQILNENDDDNRSVGDSDFVQLDQPDEVLDQDAEQEANYQTLETKFTKMLSTQNEHHQKQMEQLKDEFTKMLAEQQKQMMAQFQVQNNSLEQKLKEAVKRAQMEKNESAEIIHANREEMDKEGKQATDNDNYNLDDFSSADETDNDEKPRKTVPKWAKKEKIMRYIGAMNNVLTVDRVEKHFGQIHQPTLQALFKGNAKKYPPRRPSTAVWDSPISDRKFIHSKHQCLSPPSNFLATPGFGCSRKLSKSKILANPKGMVWNDSETEASISEYGLKATSSNTNDQWVFATEGYFISEKQRREDNFQFPGTVLCYYEVTITSSWSFSVGFTDGIKRKHAASRVGFSLNSYGIAAYYAKIYVCWLSGKEHKLECPIGAIDSGDVVGCGLLLKSKNKLAVFFTLNGMLLGKQTPINPTVNRLYPTVSICCTSVEANFGGNLVTKPFKFDMDKCPGLVFE